MKPVKLLVLFCILGLQVTHAQVCNGSLGDPILNETFGSSGYTLPPYKTTYTPAYDCPTKGTYLLTGFIFGCGPHTWTKITGDHTGNAGGNCMLVNAESTPGTVYGDTLKDLCGNTVYQFGVWVTGVMTNLACGGKPVLPNLIFTIKSLAGVTLGIDSTGDLPIVEDKDWKFFGFALRTPQDIDAAYLTITVNPKYGCGAGFAIDDITFSPCGPSISVDLDGTQGPGDVCADYTDASNPFVMTAQYSQGFDNPVLQWQKSLDSGLTWVDIQGQTGTTYKVPHRDTGTILYRIAIAEKANINSPKCRITSNVIRTTIHPLVAHAAPQSMLGCLYKPFFFPETDPHALQVLWTGPNNYQSNDPASTIPNVVYPDSGLYKLKETFYFNCVSLDTFYLKVFPGSTVNTVAGYPICEGLSEKLTASSPDDVTYKWSPSAGLSDSTIANPLAQPKDSTIYKVLVTNVYGCQDSAYVTIDVYRNPVANAGPDKSVLLGDTAILNGIVKGTNVNYSWSPAVYIDDSHAVKPHVYPVSETVYTLNVSSTLGCGSVSDDVVVKVYNDIFVPNAFTPNGDYHNDKFGIVALDNYKLLRLIIYDRWGQLVYETKNAYGAWDGTYNGRPQPPGTYVYHFELVSTAGRHVVKTGTVLLIR